MCGDAVFVYEIRTSLEEEAARLMEICTKDVEKCRSEGEMAGSYQR